MCIIIKSFKTESSLPKYQADGLVGKNPDELAQFYKEYYEKMSLDHGDHKSADHKKAKKDKKKKKDRGSSSDSGDDQKKMEKKAKKAAKKEAKHLRRAEEEKHMTVEELAIRT